MQKKVLVTDKAPGAIGPYSQGIVSGSFAFFSGQLGLDPATGQLAEGVRAQAEQIMKNIQALCEAAGGSMDGIVKTTIFLKNMADFAAVNEIYGAHFPGAKPARSTVAVAGLPKDGLVEIEAILSL